jgi:hypothetical protein
MTAPGDDAYTSRFNMDGKTVAVPLIALWRLFDQQGEGRFDPNRHWVKCKLRLPLITRLSRFALECSVWTGDKAD